MLLANLLRIPRPATTHLVQTWRDDIFSVRLPKFCTGPQQNAIPNRDSSHESQRTATTSRLLNIQKIRLILWCCLCGLTVIRLCRYGSSTIEAVLLDLLSIVLSRSVSLDLFKELGITGALNISDCQLLVGSARSPNLTRTTVRLRSTPSTV